MIKLKQLLAIALLLTAPVLATAQEPRHRMTIRITTPEGQVIYSRSAAMESSTLQLLMAACEAAAPKLGLLVPNPDYDARQPPGEDNEPQIVPTGGDAVAMAIRRFLSDLTLAYAVEAKAVAAASAERAAVKEKIDAVEFVNE